MSAPQTQSQLLVEVDLLKLPDMEFRNQWIAMTPKQRSALPDSVRAPGFDRYRKLTNYVDKSIERLRREQERSLPVTQTDIDGAALLNAVHGFLGRFVVYPSEHARIAHVLWIAHTHLMDAWESTPRIAFLSPEPASGKTRALEVTETLVPRPIEAINTTPAYLFRKVSDPEGPPTVLYDEIDTLFGPKAKDNEEIRGVLNAGHRRGAVAGRCVVRGKTIETEELPAYCAVAIAGLGNLPDTILTRSVVVKMRRRGPNESIQPYRRRVHAPEGTALREQLTAWTLHVRKAMTTWPAMPEGVTDRDADVWEALLAVAAAAGDSWLEKATAAAVALVTSAKSDNPSLGLKLLADIREMFKNADSMPTQDILKNLTGLEEAPWGDLRGKPLDARYLSNLLKPYGIGSKVLGGGKHRGYSRDAFHDAWERYLPMPPSTHVTNVTGVTPRTSMQASVTDVTDVTHSDDDMGHNNQDGEVTV